MDFQVECITMQFLIAISVATSSIYIWQSGLPQVSHLILLTVVLTNIIKRKSIKLHSESKYLLAMLVFTVLVNLTYAILHAQIQFLTAATQSLFNFFMYIGFVNILYRNPHYYASICKGITLGITIQLVVYLSGEGNYTFAPRYSGTFNDPNQMGYWLLSALAIYFILREYGTKCSKLTDIFVLATGTFLILTTVSRSAIFALFITIILLSLIKFRSIFLNYKFYLVIALSATLTITLQKEIYKILDLENSSFLLERIIEIDFNQQADERGYDRIFSFPEYLLFGSGHGLHERFNQHKNVGFIDAEIHSTWAGILFYYGIGALLLFLLPAKQIISKLNPIQSTILIGTFIYGFSTYSFRTPIFWLLLAVAMSVAQIHSTKKRLSL